MKPISTQRFICRHQVEVDVIVERHLIAPMREVIKLLTALVEEWTSAGIIPEVDWARMRSLEFQEVLRARNELVKRLQRHACTLCGDFELHARFRLSLLVFNADLSSCSTLLSTEKS